MAVCDCIHTAEPHSRPFACALADTEGFAALLYRKGFVSKTSMHHQINKDQLLAREQERMPERNETDSGSYGSPRHEGGRAGVAGGESEIE